MYCLEAERVVTNDDVVRFENRFLQLQPQRNQQSGAGARLTAQQARDGELRVVHQDRMAAFELLVRPHPRGPLSRSPQGAAATAAIPTFPPPRTRFSLLPQGDISIGR